MKQIDIRWFGPLWTMALITWLLVSDASHGATGGFDVVTTKNGDIFNGTVAQPIFTMNTQGGEVRVPYVHMARLVLSDDGEHHRIETRGGDIFIGRLQERQLKILRVLDPALPLEASDVSEISFSHPAATVPEKLVGDIVRLQNGSRFVGRVVNARFALVNDEGNLQLAKDDIHIIDVSVQTHEEGHRAQIVENGGQTHQGRLNIGALVALTDFGDELSLSPDALSLVAIGVVAPRGVSEVDLRQRINPLNLFTDLLQDGANGPRMLRLRGGRFLRGDIAGDGDDDERPVQELRIRPFAIGVHEITFDDYERFCTATGAPCPDDQGWGRDDRPVINVSWEEATAYTVWLSKVTGERYRLPTDAEWEYAARAGTKTRYWWGDGPVSRASNCEGCGSIWDGDKSAPVGRFPPNPFGLHDTAGNVFEWVADCWHGKFDDVPRDGSPLEKPNCGKRVIRGGAWSFTHRETRSANRWRDFPRRRSDDTGFRVARELAVDGR